MDALKNFFLATQNLREALESGLSLDDFDRITLENYLALLHLSYSDWRRQNRPAKVTDGSRSASNSDRKKDLSSSSHSN